MSPDWSFIYYGIMLWILSVILAPEPTNKYVFMDRPMDQSIYGVERELNAFQVPYVGNSEQNHFVNYTGL